MTENYKKQWIDALRSGQYGQCREVLTDGHDYCCLGVGADVLSKAGALPEEFDQCWRSDGQVVADCEDLPSTVLALLGIDDDMQRHLIALNDDGVGFKDIASYIAGEKTLEEVQTT